MLHVKLNDLYFYSYHGIYEEETLTGGEFIVNIIFSYSPKTTVITELEETIDYGAAFEIVKQRMQQATPLLETIAMELADQLLNKFRVAEQVEVSIKKVKPPIKNFTGSAETVFVKKRM